MKLIHCADIHLDSKMSANLTLNKAAERNDEILDTFRRLVDYAHSNGVTHIMISGDLFDTERVTNKTRRFIQELIEHNTDIIFLYLRGNHDDKEKLKCNTNNFVTFSDEWSYYAYENVVIAGIEFTRSNFGTYYDKLKLEANNINIVMLHGQTHETDIKFEGINTTLLQNKNIDYMALGHIHEHYHQELDSRGIWVYSGCLEGRGFDECGDKGFIEIETFEHTVSWKYVPFARREIQSINVDITGSESVIDIQNKISESVRNIDKDTILRVVLTGKYQLGLNKDIKLLTKAFDNEFYSFKIKDSSRLLIDISEYENDISLKGEYIRCIMGLDIPDEEKDLYICLGIQALSGEALQI